MDVDVNGALTLEEINCFLRSGHRAKNRGRKLLSRPKFATGPAVQSSPRIDRERAVQASAEGSRVT